MSKFRKDALVPAANPLADTAFRLLRKELQGSDIAWRVCENGAGEHAGLREI
jgi:hypothetical protein